MPTVQNITVLCANPCIDWQYNVGTFVAGSINRVSVQRQTPAGKGLNVCLALKNFGTAPLYVGFDFASGGEQITRVLDENAVQHCLVPTAGQVRTNIKLYEESTNTMTELNQPGPCVTAQDARDLAAILRQIGRNRGGLLILSGSLPRGITDDFYANCIKNWPGRAFLDADGARLAAAMAQPPYAIKPNLREAREIFCENLHDASSLRDYMRDVLFRGAARPQLVCVSMGADGAVLAHGDDIVYSPAIPVGQRSTQGAGDAMVAALAYGIAQNAAQSADALLRSAIAAAAASLTSSETLACTHADFHAMLARAPQPISL